MEKYKEMWPDNVIGKDGMYDEQRRTKFIDACKILNIETSIGQGWNNVDNTPFLNLMVRIPNREGVISCIFSHHTITCLIETQTSYFSQEEEDFCTNNGLNCGYNECSIHHWDSIEELILFVTLLKQYNNP